MPGSTSMKRGSMDLRKGRRSVVWVASLFILACGGTAPWAYEPNTADPGARSTGLRVAVVELADESAGEEKPWVSGFPLLIPLLPYLTSESLPATAFGQCLAE